MSLRRAVAYRQGDLDADLPGAELVFEKVPESGSETADELVGDRRDLGCFEGPRPDGRDKGPVLYARNHRGANGRPGYRICERTRAGCDSPGWPSPAEAVGRVSGHQVNLRLG